MDKKASKLVNTASDITSNINNTVRISNDPNGSAPKNKNNEHNINRIKKFNDPQNALMQQDLNVRHKFIDIWSKNNRNQESLRKLLSHFYLIFISMVTFCIFFVIIDPIGLYRGKMIYPESIKVYLIGAFFANILSILAIMFHYSFKFSNKRIMDQFYKLGKKDKK